MLASLLMVIGYGIIAVPTGIVTLELQKASEQ
jgi:voltage-gated potassium channel